MSKIITKISKAEKFSQNKKYFLSTIPKLKTTLLPIKIYRFPKNIPNAKWQNIKLYKINHIIYNIRNRLHITYYSLADFSAQPIRTTIVCYMLSLSRNISLELTAAFTVSSISCNSIMHIFLVYLTI